MSMASRAAVPIAVRALRKTYGAVRALDDVDLDVRSGEFLTLLGPSGSGKTTLLMVLAGFIRPDQGSLMFGDQEVIRLAPHKRDIGMVFQNYALFPHMDVAANVAYPLKLRGVREPELGQRVDAALQTMQLAGYGARRVDQLSGGQRQRVALARAIVFEPRIVLMDEPLSALDKQLRERMQIELRQLHDQLGTTTIYVTHDQREALTMSDRIAVINGGRIMQLDTPQAIYEQPANRFVAEFIGESTFLKGVIQGDRCECAGQVLRTARASASATPSAGPVELMLRPERVRVMSAAASVPDAGTQPIENRLQAQVTHVVYQGDSVLVQAVLVDGSSISARIAAGGLAGANGLQAGQSVQLAFDVADTMVLAQ